MYKHTQSAIGKFILHELSDPTTNTGFKIVPGRGGIVLDIFFEGVSILDGYQSAIDLDINRWGKSALLYPFPNRLKQGRYKWNGEHYQFPINDDQTGNALHGLGMDKPMHIIKIVTAENHASIECQYNDPGEDPAYPFPFSFSVNFAISNDNTFTGTFAMTNDGKQDLPAGFGWHPYFALSDSVDKMQLQLPTLEMVGIDRNMIPTGKKYAFEDYETAQAIGVNVLDNCFFIKENGDKAVLHLEGTKGKLEYWQETGAGKYQFVQLFTPPARNSLAIEPMTCNVDAFNNGEGLIRLQPGHTASASFGIAFQAV